MKVLYNFHWVSVSDWIWSFPLWNSIFKSFPQSCMSPPCCTPFFQSGEVCSENQGHAWLHSECWTNPIHLWTPGLWPGLSACVHTSSLANIYVLARLEMSPSTRCCRWYQTWVVTTRLFGRLSEHHDWRQVSVHNTGDEAKPPSVVLSLWRNLSRRI